MTSKTSYNNLGKNVRDQLHKMRSFILLLGVIYLAAGPAWLLLQMTSYTSYNNLTMLLTFYIGYFTPFYYLALVLGFAGGVYITRYQQVPNQSNFYHSLPITRSGLLSARLLALLLVQVLLLIVVTMVDLVVVAVTVPALGNELTLHLIAAAGIHFCYIMLMFLLSLAVTLFAGQLTANIVGQVLMTVVLHASVWLFGAVLNALICSFDSTVGQIGLLEHLTRFNIIAGFIDVNTSVVARLHALNPVLTSSESASNFAPSLLAWPLSTTIIYIVLIVGLMAGTYALYQRRAVEKTGDTLLNPYVGNVIKAFYVFCGAIVSGLVFREMIAESVAGMIIGIILAMIVIHMIAEMIYSMDVDGVRRHYISTLVGVVLALAVMFGFQSGFLSLDQRLPDADNVKGAVIVYDYQSNVPTNLDNAYATNPETIKKVMTAAEQAKDKNYVPDSYEEDLPNLTTLTLTYNTIFGQNTRTYSLSESDARAIMLPLLNDANVVQAVNAGLIDANISDFVDMSYSPVFSDYVGGYDTYLIQAPQNNGTAKTNTSLIKDEKEGAQRAEALLKAVQSDLAKRNAEVYQTRIIGRLNYSVMTKDQNNQSAIDWSNSLTLYEGDTATAALLAQWREEGFIDDETEMMTSMLKDYEVSVYNPNDATPRERVGTVNIDDFIAAFIAGDILSSSQVRDYGAKVQDNMIFALSNEPIESDDGTYIGDFYLREGAELPIQSVQ